MSQLKQRERSPLLCLFVVFRPSTDWVMAGHTGEGGVLYSAYPFTCYSLPETQTHSEVMLFQLSGHP